MDRMFKLLTDLNFLAKEFFNIKDPSPLAKLIFVSLLLAIGIIFIIGLKDYENFRGVLAGAFIGASVSAICSFLTSDKGLSREELTKIVDDALSNPKTSRLRLDVDSLRKSKHFYYHTSDAGGPFWIYLKMENYNFVTPYIAEIVIDIPKSRHKHRYNFEIFISDPNLIMRARPEDMHEKTALNVVLDYCIKLGSENGGYYGFHSHLNWNRKDRVNPLLLLNEPVEGTQEMGRQSDLVSQKLIERWLSLADNSLDDVRKIINDRGSL